MSDFHFLRVIEKGLLYAVLIYTDPRYGINPIPFGKAIDRNPESAEGKMLTNILWDLAAH